MNISCNSCGKVHSIPDNSVANKKIYFYCSACRHKIIVDSRTKISEMSDEVHSLANFTDIFSGLFSFFNWAGILVSILQLVVSVLILGISSQIFYRNFSFFMNNRGLAVFLGLFVFLIILYTRNLVLYYISKIQSFQFEHPEKNYTDWRSIHFDLEEDWITVFLYSCAAIIALFILIFPLPFIRSFGTFYAGVFFPLIFTAALFIILMLILSRFLPAIIAAGSYFVKDGIKEIFSFIVREYAQMPFYWIVITVITRFFGVIFFALYSAVLFLAGSFIFVFMSGEGRDSLIHFFASLPMMRSAQQSIPAYVSLGAVILFIMVFLSFTLFIAFMDNFIQSLYVKAVIVMIKNPRESFNRYAMLIILALLILISILTTLLVSNISAVQIPAALQKFPGI